jgi:hypothetical protein
LPLRFLSCRFLSFSPYYFTRHYFHFFDIELMHLLLLSLLSAFSSFILHFH